MDALTPGMDLAASSPGVTVGLPGRVSGFIRAGGRAVVLVDPSVPDRAATLDGILATLPGEVIRIGNPLASALTLHRLLFQLGIEDEGGDVGGLIVCALDVPSGTDMAMLAVDDAHSLTPDAVAALARVPSPASADQAGRLLLLSGGPGLLALVSGSGCEVFCDPCLTLTVVAPASAGAAASASSGEPGVADTLSPGAGPLSAGPLSAGPLSAGPLSADGNRRWWIGLLLAGSFLAGLIGTPVLFWIIHAPAPLLPGAQGAGPALPAAVPHEPAGEAAGAPALPQAAPDMPKRRGTLSPQPTLALADARLRQDFDAFLSRAGRDTAGLSARARERLFREYLDWRTGNAGRADVRRPGAP